MLSSIAPPLIVSWQCIFSISLSTKDENIKYYLGGGLGALSPISEIIRIFDSAPQLSKIKSLLPCGGGGVGAHPRNHFTTRNKRIIHVTHIINFLNWIPREEWSLAYTLHVFWANYDSCWHWQYLRVYYNAPVVTVRLTTNKFGWAMRESESQAAYQAVYLNNYSRLIKRMAN